MRTILLFLMTSALAVASASAETPSLKDIRISLVPENTSFMMSEPIFLSFIVHNDSAQDRWTLLSGIQGFKKVQAVRDDGLSATDLHKPEFPDPGIGGNFQIGPGKIPAYGSHTFRLFLPDYLKIEDPGEYTIIATRAIEVVRKNAEVWGKNESVDVQATTKVTIRPFDQAAFDDVIRSLDAVARGPDPYPAHPAQDASRALQAIEDDRTVDLFIRTISESNGPHPEAPALLELRRADAKIRMRVLMALLRTSSPESLEWVRQMTRDADSVVREVALEALTQKPTDESLKVAIEMAGDPERRIRRIALTTIAKRRTPEAVEAIRRMTKDSDKLARESAKHYLKATSKLQIGITGRWATDCSGDSHISPPRQWKPTAQELWRRLLEESSDLLCAVSLTLNLKTDAATGKLKGSITVLAGRSSDERKVADGHTSGSQFSFRTTVKIGGEITEIAWNGVLTDENTIRMTAASASGKTLVRTLHRAK